MGILVGILVGILLGTIVGRFVGNLVGITVGRDGLVVGRAVGLLGTAVGRGDGLAVGLLDCCTVATMDNTTIKKANKSEVCIFDVNPIYAAQQCNIDILHNISTQDQSRNDSRSRLAHSG